MVSIPCISCKGNLKCGRTRCPIYFKSVAMFKAVEDLGSEFFGSSPPSVFVGSKLPYPAVNVGILSPPQRVEDAWVYDAQKYWADKNYNIKQVINFRSSLINSRFRANVYDVRRNYSKFLELSQEIGMAIRPVDVEIELKKRVRLSLDFDNTHLPMGPRAPLKKVRLTENPEIPTKIDKVVSDTDLKAAGAIDYLYGKDFAEDTLTKLLSIGVLGLAKNRKLVSTRSSITAVDDLVGKSLLKGVRDYPQMNDYVLYFGYYLGNYYLVMFFPDVINYELFEMYLPGSSWNPSKKLEIATDYEDYYGRKGYATNTVGGYYASRIGVLEQLNRMKRQASVLVLRFETPEYWCQLGVWVCREAMRKTLRNKPFVFDDKEKMFEEARKIIYDKLRFDINSILKRSKIVEQIKSQVKLTKFF